MKIEKNILRSSLLSAVVCAATALLGSSLPLQAQNNASVKQDLVQRAEKALVKAEYGMRAIGPAKVGGALYRHEDTRAQSGKWFSRAIEVARRSGESARFLMYVAEAQIDAGDLEDARQVLKEFVPESKKVDLFWEGQNAVSVLMKAGMASEALQLAYSIKNDAYKARALGVMAALYAKNGNLAASRETFATACRVADRQTEKDAQAATYLSLVDDYLDAQDLTSAQALIPLIGDPRNKGLCWLYIAKSQAKAGQTAAARTSLSTGEKNLDMMDIADINYSYALVTVVETKLAIGDIASAQMTANRLRDRRAKSLALRAFVEFYSEKGDVENANTFFAQMSEKGRGGSTSEEDYTRVILARALANKGEIVAMQAILNDITDAGAQLEAVAACLEAIS